MSADILQRLKEQASIGNVKAVNVDAPVLLALIAKIEALEADVARYHWLRNKSLGYDQIGSFTPYVVIGQIMDTVDGHRLDERIDAAIAGAKS